MNTEDLKDLYFKLQRKNSAEPTDYTMTEIEKIAENVVKILEQDNKDHEAIPAFKKVKEQSDYYHRVSKTWKKSQDIEDLKSLAMQAFQELFDREPGINV